MIYIVLTFLGLCFGSFINALVWRLHQQFASKRKTTTYSITRGYSMCPSCHHRLSARDLVPVLSWIELHGHCRYCQVKIGWQYPLIELLTAGLFILSYTQWAHDFSPAGILAFGLWLTCLAILIALMVYDIRWMLLPDRLVYPLTVVAVLLTSSLSLAGGGWGRILGSLLGALLLSGLFWSIFQISGGNWIGGGDVKLAVGLGMLAGGLLESVVLLLIASSIGSLVSIPLVIHNKKLSRKVPFGPFLIIATFVVFFWGGTIIDWYSRILGV